jgi:hypothetical protein
MSTARPFESVRATKGAWNPDFIRFTRLQNLFVSKIAAVVFAQLWYTTKCSWQRDDGNSEYIFYLPLFKQFFYICQSHFYEQTLFLIYVNVIKLNTWPRQVIEKNTEGHIHCSICYMYFIPAVHCRNNSCENGGTCLDAYSTYCYCAAGFTGYSCETSKWIMCLVDIVTQVCL